MTPSPEKKSTEELSSAEAEARAKVVEAENEANRAFAAWKPVFVESVRASVHEQARLTAKREADRTLAMSPDEIDGLKRQLKELADEFGAALDSEVTLGRISQPLAPDRGTRGVHEGPGGAHRQLLEPVEERIGRLMESAGYSYDGWIVAGSSRAWHGPQLDEAEQDLFRTLGLRINRVASARADLARASERPKASRALDAWGD